MYRSDQNLPERKDDGSGPKSRITWSMNARRFDECDESRGRELDGCGDRDFGGEVGKAVFML